MRTAGPTALLAALLVLALVPAASARAEELQVSLDGQRWTSRIDRPLFTADRLWVPGDAEAVTVWARNTSDDGAELTLSVLDRSGTRLAEDLRPSALADGRPLALGPDAGYRVPPGAPVRVEITLTFPAAAGNGSQQQSTRLVLRLALTQRPEAPPAEPGGPGRTPDPAVPSVPPGRASGLPDTGPSALVTALSVAAPLLLAAGTVLLGRRRARTPRGAR